MKNLKVNPESLEEIISFDPVEFRGGPCREKLI